MSSPAALCYNALPHCLGSGWDPGTRVWQSLRMKASASVLTHRKYIEILRAGQR